MSETYCPNYYISPELKVIYGLFYPQLNFEDFLARSHSEITEPFHVGFYDLSPELQNLEPDLELRQLLYYLKPAADFRAYPEFVKVLRRIVAALTDMGINLRSLAIPFESLLKTALKIQQAVQRNYETTSLGTLFPQFRPQALSHLKARAAGRYYTSNPMFRKGCSTFPLYSIALNNMRWPETESDSEMKEYRGTDNCNALLIAAIYLCANERRLTPISEDRDLNTLTKESLHRNPYTFLLQEPDHAPDRSKLCDIDRKIRLQSQSWLDLSQNTRRLLERIISRPYPDLGRFPVCHKKHFNRGFAILIFIGIFTQFLKLFETVFANGRLGQAINFNDIAIEILFLSNELGRNFPSMVSC